MTSDSISTKQKSQSVPFKRLSTLYTHPRILATPLRTNPPSVLLMPHACANSLSAIAHLSTPSHSPINAASWKHPSQAGNAREPHQRKIRVAADDRACAHASPRYHTYMYPVGTCSLQSVRLAASSLGPSVSKRI